MHRRVILQGRNNHVERTTQTRIQEYCRQHRQLCQRTSHYILFPTVHCSRLPDVPRRSSYLRSIWLSQLNIVNISQSVIDLYVFYYSGISIISIMNQVLKFNLLFCQSVFSMLRDCYCTVGIELGWIKYCILTTTSNYIQNSNLCNHNSGISVFN